MTDKSLLEHFQGCIVGKCVGDALGFLVEGSPQDVCTDYVESYILPLKVPPGNRGIFSFGQYSDDSQLARELMISLVDQHRFDPVNYALRIAHLFEFNEIIGKGNATTNSAMRLINGIPWNISGEPAPYAGNGSAMRVAPIGLFYWNQPDLIKKFSMQQSSITHADDRCLAGSYIVALSVSYVLTHEEIDSGTMLDYLSLNVKPMNDLFAQELINLKNWLSLPFQDVVNHIATSGKPEFPDPFWDKISPYVIPTVLISLYSFLMNKINFLDSIATAIKVGGDVDTTAAITGAISGAFLGVKSIPEIFSHSINDQGKWGFLELCSLAEQLYNQVNKK